MAHFTIVQSVAIPTYMYYNCIVLLYCKVLYTSSFPFFVWVSQERYTVLK